MRHYPHICPSCKRALNSVVTLAGTTVERCGRCLSPVSRVVHKKIKIGFAFLIVLGACTLSSGVVAYTKGAEWMQSIQENRWKKERDFALERNAILLASLSLSFAQDIDNNGSMYALDVEATGYSATVAQCDSTPEIDSNLEPTCVGSLAISRDLEKFFPLNSFVIIKGLGLFKITGRMNERFTKRVDICFGNEDAANLFGVQKVTILYWR